MAKSMKICLRWA